MNYPTQTTKEFATKLLALKEFGSLKRARSDDPDKYFQLAPHQAFIQSFLNPHSPWRSIHLQHACHSPDTQVLMEDGTVKKCKDLRVGDNLSGEQGASQITELHSGFDDMYEFATCDGRAFTCNSTHILCLVVQRTSARGVTCSREDMTVQQYLDLPAGTKSWLFSMSWNRGRRSKYCWSASYMTQLGKWVGSGLTVDVPENICCFSAEQRVSFLRGIVNVLKKCPSTTKSGNKYVLESSAVGIVQRVCWSCGVKCNLAGASLNICWPNTRRDVACRPIYSLLSFTVARVGAGEYCGFTLDGCPRYSLANYIISHNTGVGKTIGGLAAAQTFASVYRALYSRMIISNSRRSEDYRAADVAIPNIFVFGFDSTKKAFLRDLLKYPKFGFVTSVELEELNLRNKLADQGIPGAVESARDYYNILRRRVFKKSQGGFLRVYGYEEFVNRLFLTELKLVELEKEADVNNLDLEQIIVEKLRTGEIVLNTALLNSFQNSVLICDEIHNTYNSITKNSRGIALKYLIDAVPTLRFITLTATPMNNLPVEFAELADYHLPEDRRVKKHELFSHAGRNLLPGSLDKIREMSRGWISYFRDDNPALYPTHTIEGVSVAVSGFPSFKDSQIPFLKFIAVEMSEYHQATLEAYVSERDVVEEQHQPGDISIEHYVISTDAYALLDIAFPAEHANSETLVTPPGIYRSRSVVSNLVSYSDAWKQKVGIVLKNEPNTVVISGPWLALPSLATYSTKYAKLIEMLFDGFRAAKGNPQETTKSLIFHMRVRNSGVFLLREILKENGVLDHIASPASFTVCLVCGLRMSEHHDRGWLRGHDGIADHLFIPARFRVVHADLDKGEMNEALTTFSQHTNYLGHHCAIMLGSKIIRESYEFKDVRALYIVNVPLNISMLRQIIGRVIRNGSHYNLPAEKRHVSINILAHAVNPRYPRTYELSPEMYRYAFKTADYLVIQQIEQVMNEVAVDAVIHRDNIMSPVALKEFFPDCPQCWNKPTGCECVAKPVLEGLYFEPEDSAVVPEELSKASWLAYGGNFREIETISFVIKRLFISQPVWTYEDLWREARSTKMNIPLNPETFSEDSFMIALKKLIDPATEINLLDKTGSLKTAEKFSTEELLTDYNQRNIRRPNGSEYTVRRAGEYYFLTPVDAVADVNCFSRGNTSSASITCRIDEYNVTRPLKDVRAWNDTWLSRSRQSLPELGFLADVSTQYQEHVARSIITGESASIPALEIAQKLLVDLDVFVFPAEVKKYASVSSQFSWVSNENVKTPADNTPIGYTKGKHIHFYDNGSWFTNNRVVLNRQHVGKEGKPIVGMFVSIGDEVMFKIRPPVGASGRSIETAHGVVKKHIDARTVERGITCTTKHKELLAVIARQLGIDVPKQLSRRSMRVGNICDAIAQVLVDREINARSQREFTKHIYGWWDDDPQNIQRFVKK
jgi:hypothetical protein